MQRKGPTPLKFKLVVAGALREINGFESCHALGVVATGNGFGSVMLMPGLILEDGFGSVAEAHAFNLAAVAHPDLFVGTPFIEEFMERAGGEAKARETIAKIRKQLEKK